MPIIRAKHGKGHPFTRVANSLLNDNRLTMSDRGLASCILSLDGETWTFTESGLSKRFGISRGAVRRSLEHFEALGFLARAEQKRDPVTKRYLPREWVFYEEPRVPKQNTESDISPGESVSTFPTAENGTVITNNIKKTCTEGDGLLSQGMDYQPSKPPIVDRWREWRPSNEACRLCGTVGLLTDGVAYKCETCEAEFSSFNEMLGIPGYQAY